MPQQGNSSNPSRLNPLTVQLPSHLPGSRTAALQAETVELSRMSEALKQHLSPPEPVTLRYTIRPDGPPSAHPDCYDFEVEVPLRWGQGAGLGSVLKAGWVCVG